MRSFTSLSGLVSSFLLFGLALAAPYTPRDIDLRDSGSYPTSCNTPSNRACWSDGFDINTDYETQTPSGKVVQYTFTVTEHDNWEAPDGSVKVKAMLINNQFPGPTIVADWGDTIQVTVINNLQYNGTSIHWHGLRQFGTVLNDGANGVTECPIPPQGGSKVYTFKATQYGTTWYHSHYSAQYGNGVSGSIQINGPASLPYDINLGVFPITDWYNRGADQIVKDTMNKATGGAPPLADNVFFNGTNVSLDGTKGQYANVTLTPGKRHRLRIINPSVENNFQVSLSGHQFTVISTDLVPVNSFTTESLFLATGQRYDVTIDASEAVDNYWFNVTYSATGACGNSTNPHPAAIFHYAGASGDLPTEPGKTPADTFCADSIDFSPVVTRSAPQGDFSKAPDNTLPVVLDLGDDVSTVTWKVNGSAVNVNWENPVIESVLRGNASVFATSENVIRVDKKDTWTFWLIENQSPLPHPMHLHGHDFLVVGRSDAPSSPFTGHPTPYNPGSDAGRLKGQNPTRRDVTMLPANGWLVVAFKTDNPGAWLFHCHIAWHVSGGLSVQFLERENEIKDAASPADVAAFNQNCNAWRKYSPTDPFPREDSGI